MHKTRVWHLSGKSQTHILDEIKFRLPLLPWQVVVQSEADDFSFYRNRTFHK